MHQARDVLQAHVSGQQFFVVEHAHAAVPFDLVAVEREVHFFDAVTLGQRTECRFGARCAATEQNAVRRVHQCDDNAMFVWHVYRARVDRGFS
jgi:hypothetical protein